MASSPPLQSENAYDVLIVGAGINGAAAARELRQMGYSVLVVDRCDLGGVATARSGRVLHCGLQLLAPAKSVWGYLSNPLDLVMRLRQARQTALDFNEWRSDPGRLAPMTTLVPLFRGEPLKGWQVDLGAMVIRALGARDFGYRRLGAGGWRDDPFVTALGRADLASVVAFRDHRILWPERIAIDACLEAEAAGAHLRPFTELVQLRHLDDGCWHARLSELTEGGQRDEILARFVLNLAGARVDEVVARAGPVRPIAQKTIAIKGVYLLVRLPARYRGTGLAGLNSLGEPICCLPWDDFHYIGPTETRYEGAFDDVRPEEDDVAFLLEEMVRFAPGLELGRDDVVMAWAGLRAITAAPAYPKGKRLPYGVISDLAAEGLPNMATLSWGIIVNHRSTVRKLARLVSSRIRPSGKPLPAPRNPRHFRAGSMLTAGDVAHCVQHEHARDLYGVLSSRTGQAWTGRLTRAHMNEAAAAMAKALSWDGERTARECEAFATRMRREHLYELR